MHSRQGFQVRTVRWQACCIAIIDVEQRICCIPECMARTAVRLPGFEHHVMRLPEKQQS